MQDVSTKIYYTSMGAANGMMVGVIKYWNHFTSEVSYRFLDACAITAGTTLVGATLSYFLLLVYKKYFPHKGKD